MKRTQTPKKRDTTASDDTEDSGLNLSTEDTKEVFPTTDE